MVGGGGEEKTAHELRDALSRLDRDGTGVLSFEVYSQPVYVLCISIPHPPTMVRRTSLRCTAETDVFAVRRACNLRFLVSLISRFRTALLSLGSAGLGWLGEG